VSRLRQEPQLGVDGIEVESGAVERSPDPLDIVIVFFVSRIGECLHEVLVTAGVTDVIGRTGVLAMGALGERRAGR
jgi:hypothetical protein